MCMCLCMWVFACVCVFVFVFVWVYLCVYVCVRVCVWQCACVHVCKTPCACVYEIVGTGQLTVSHRCAYSSMPHIYESHTHMCPSVNTHTHVSRCKDMPRVGTSLTHMCVRDRVRMCIRQCAYGYVAVNMRDMTHSHGEVGGWGRDPKKCTGRDWGMGSSTI